MKLIVSCLVAFLLPALIDAQLSGSDGPTTSTAHKRSTKQCNILNYGGVASESYDNGPAIASAWAACKSGSEGMLSHQGLGRVLLTMASLHSFW
jgi:rhamnogalacturonan hydrolase